MHVDVHGFLHAVAPVLPDDGFVQQVPGAEGAGARVEPRGAGPMGIHLHIGEPMDQVAAAIVAGLHIGQAEVHAACMQTVEHLAPSSPLILRHIDGIPILPVNGGGDEQAVPGIHGGKAPVAHLRGDILGLAKAVRQKGVAGDAPAGAVAAVAGVATLHILAAGAVGRETHVQVLVIKGAALSHQAV